MRIVARLRRWRRVGGDGRGGICGGGGVELWKAAV
jgi:hypothetical protein